MGLFLMIEVMTTVNRSSSWSMKVQYCTTKACVLSFFILFYFELKTAQINHAKCPGQVIDGLDESVMTMEEGEVAEFTIPPQHAFDAVGSDQHQFPFVPRNATVVYKIELLSVVNVRYFVRITGSDGKINIIEYTIRFHNS
jgi:hypothetical protein